MVFAPETAAVKVIMPVNRRGEIKDITLDIK